MPDFEAQLRSALRERAEQLVPSVSDPVRDPAPRRRRQRLPLLVAAASAVILIGAGITVSQVRSSDRAAMGGGPGSASVVADGVPLVDGILLPLPSGLVISQIPSNVPSTSRYCIDFAAAPAADCRGLQLVVGRPDVTGVVTPVPLPAWGRDDCPNSSTLTTVEAVRFGGRPAQLYRDRCRSGGAELLVWQTADGSLMLTTPRGGYAPEGHSVASRINLSGWSHHTQGPPVTTPGG